MYEAVTEGEWTITEARAPYISQNLSDLFNKEIPVRKNESLYAIMGHAMDLGRDAHPDEATEFLYAKMDTLDNTTSTTTDLYMGTRNFMNLYSALGGPSYDFDFWF